MTSSAMTLEHITRGHEGKLVHKWEGYFAHYERNLSSFRDQPVRLLEIGVQNGGSLEVWSRFFPQARTLVGCDIDPLCEALVFNDPRIHVVVGDANSAPTRSRILELSDRFDIIIDDGSHTSGDIVRSFCAYFPLLEDGGIYIVEDLHCSYWQQYEGGLFHPHSSLSFFKHLGDIPNREHWGIELSEDRMLGSFLRHHRTDISSDALRHIHSVEFANSMCFIRKNVPHLNGIGRRVVAGQQADVSSIPRAVGPSIEIPAQSANPWSALEAPAAAQLQEIARRFIGDKAGSMGADGLVKAIRAENDALRARVKHLESSIFHRCGAPFRLLRRVINYGPRRLWGAVARYFGPKPSAWDAAAYVKSHWSVMGEQWAKFPWLHYCLFAQPEATDGGTRIRFDDPKGAANCPAERPDRHIGHAGLRGILRPPTDRTVFFGQISRADGLGLEIGPLDNPMCRKNDCDVRYLDVFTAEELRTNYATDPNVDVGRIVDVDLVWKGESYANLTRERFDYVVSCHNLEHSPCLVSFLRNIESCLKPGGKVYLAAPDHRFCFDHFKPESSLTDILEAYRQRLDRPAPRSILRHRLYLTHNSPVRHWRGDHGLPAYVADAGVAALDVLDEWDRLEESASYTDTHTWIFTPGSFADAVDFLHAQGLTGLRLAALHPTARHGQEFFAQLERVTKGSENH